MKKKKKNAFTLLEIMIVIFLIGLIGSIIGYNMKGSMDEGRAFKTKQAQARLRDILELEMAKGASAADVNNSDKRKDLLTASGIAKNPEKLLKDGWGNAFDISAEEDGTIKIISKTYDEYKSKKKNLRGHDDEEN
jgi:general secretion pathway protein G